MEDAEGNTVEIQEITQEKHPEGIKVYNFEVKQNHDYYVGEVEVLVHNRCDVNSDDFTEITLKHVEGMPVNQFNRKANSLQKLGDNGRLYKAQNPVSRNPAITRGYRKDMIKRIWNQYGSNNPEFANSLIERVTKKMQPDHVWELQLGGPDSTSNLKFLDSFTNWHIGTQQIRPQIRNLPTGTKIKVKIIK